MKTIADFIPWVELEAQDTPAANIQHATREALVYFMRETGAAVDEMFIDLAPNQDDMALVTPSCQRIVGINSVWLAPKCNMARWSPEWIRILPVDSWGNGYALDDTGGPLSMMWLYPIMRKPQRVCIKYRWTIGRDACDVPDWIYEDYAKVIASGALAYLHRNPQDPSTSTAFTTVVGAEFETAVRTLAARVKLNYSGHARKTNGGWGRRG